MRHERIKCVVLAMSQYNAFYLSRKSACCAEARARGAERAPPSRWNALDGGIASDGADFIGAEEFSLIHAGALFGVCFPLSLAFEDTPPEGVRAALGGARFVDGAAVLVKDAASVFQVVACRVGVSKWYKVCAQQGASVGFEVVYEGIYLGGAKVYGAGLALAAGTALCAAKL